MNRSLTLFIATLLGLVSNASAQHMLLTDFTYFSESEHVRPSTLLSHWDWIDGRLQTNDTMLLRGGLYGRITSAGPLIITGNAELPDGYAENQPPIEFSMTAKELRSISRHVTSNNGQLMTWIKMKGDQGIDVYQYPLGGSPAESLLFHMTPPGWAGLFVDGQCEIEGELTGQLTIGSSDKMWLVDNIRYKGANALTGDFQEDGMSHILGLVSEKDIIIQDNFKNGKWDGANAEPNNNERHSIVINAAICALGGSFTFEHQNNEWDLYRSPTVPDERGMIWLKGCVIQKRAGYIHTNNRVGTGYGTHYSYDSRLLNWQPIGFEVKVERYYLPRYERIHLRKGVSQFWNPIIGTLEIDAGCELNFSDVNGIEVTDSLIINGTEIDPVVFNGLRSLPVRVGGNRVSYTSISHLKANNEISWEFESGNHSISNSSFMNNVTFGGTLTIDSCQFANRVKLLQADEVTISRSVIDGGILATIVRGSAEIRNCTIVNSPRAGIEILRIDEMNILNCIITGNRWGVLSSGLQDPIIRYCDVTDNLVDDYVDCDAGEGCISRDPRFVGQHSSDYHLESRSPCIDAGDPTSALDPDGSRVDIGAFYFPHRLGVTDDEKQPTPAELNYGVSAAPNPFNSQTTITYQLKSAGVVQISILDLTGRTIATLAERSETAGLHTLAWDASSVPAGIYLVRANGHGWSSTAKLLKVD